PPVEAAAGDGEDRFFEGEGQSEPLPELSFEALSGELASGSHAVETLVRMLRMHAAAAPENNHAEFEQLMRVLTTLKNQNRSETSPFDALLLEASRRFADQFETALSGGAQKQHEVLIQFADFVRKEAQQLLQ